MRLADLIDDPIILRQLIEMADVALAVRYPLTAGAIYDTADRASIARSVAISSISFAGTIRSRGLGETLGCYQSRHDFSRSRRGIQGLVSAFA